MVYEKLWDVFTWLEFGVSCIRWGVNNDHVTLMKNDWNDDVKQSETNLLLQMRQDSNLDWLFM